MNFSDMEVNSREDFLKFLEEIYKDLLINKDKEYWENPTLERYLEAMRAWIIDMDKKKIKENPSYNPEEISWSKLKDIFIAASIYE